MIKKIRFLVNSKLGLDVVKFTGHHNLRSHLYQIFYNFKIESIIDVGANEGQFGLFLREIGFKGKIFSFEPVKQAFEKLNIQSSKDENWDVFNFALGSKISNKKINVAKSSIFSSFLELNNYGSTTWSNSEIIHKEIVEIKTLDYCFDKNLIFSNNNILLKIDTQGFDIEVIKGFTKENINLPIIISELPLKPLYRGMKTFEEYLKFYKEVGYTISGLYPVTRSEDFSVNEFDCVLVKKIGR